MFEQIIITNKYKDRSYTLSVFVSPNISLALAVFALVMCYFLGFSPAVVDRVKDPGRAEAPRRRFVSFRAL